MKREHTCQQGNCTNTHFSGDGRGVTVNSFEDGRYWLCSWRCLVLYAQKLEDREQLREQVRQKMGARS